MKKNTAMICRSLILTATTFAVLGGLAGCASEPLVSRKGVSGVALGEFDIEALMIAAGGRAAPDNIGNLDISDTLYLGGIIPIKKPAVGLDLRVNNGTKFFVDGRKRGCLPRVLKVGKPGPHVIRLEIPVRADAFGDDSDPRRADRSRGMASGHRGLPERRDFYDSRLLNGEPGPQQRETERDR